MSPTLLFVTYKYYLSTIILKEATHMCQFFQQLWIDPKILMIALTDFFCPHWWLASHQIEKKLLNHWKQGDKSFRICNPSNWSSWHLLLTNRDAMPSLLIPPFSVIFTHSYRAVLSLQFFASCVAWDPSFEEVDAAWQKTWKAFALALPSVDSALLF